MIVNNRRTLRPRLTNSVHNLIRIADFPGNEFQDESSKRPRGADTFVPKAVALMRLTLCVIAILASSNPGRTDMTRGVSTFASQSQCASSGRLSPETCAIADANAAAEFDEKAPRFPSRAACERVYGACALGFRGADGWAGRRNGIYFTPQRHGFRVTVTSDHDATVAPIAAGLNFAPRSAIRRDASIKPRSSREYTSSGYGDAGQSTAAFGVSTADGAKGPLPPPPSIDPNFDCAAVLEPSDKGDPGSGCYLAPARRR